MTTTHLTIQMKYDDRGNAGHEYDAADLLEELADELRMQLDEQLTEISQLEMVLSPLEQPEPTIGLKLVGDELEIGSCPTPLTDGELKLTLAADTDSEPLAQAADIAIEEVVAIRHGLMFRIDAEA